MKHLEIMDIDKGYLLSGRVILQVCMDPSD